MPMATPGSLANDIPDEPDYQSSNPGSESEDDELTGGPSTRTALEVPLMPLQDPDKDQVHQNLCLFTCDLLYVTELVHAISDGDLGHIKDMLPMLAMIFWGAGGNNYCTEILHFILNLKHVWTPQFACVYQILTLDFLRHFD